MSENINGVPVVFMGFTKPEETGIREAIGTSVETGMSQYEAWPIVGDCLKKANINNCVFVCTTGIQFVKVGSVHTDI